MQLVLDHPVGADGDRGLLGIDRAIGQIERGFRRALPKARRRLENIDHAFNLNDSHDMSSPIGSGDGRLGVENADGSGLVTIAPFLVDGLNDRQRLGGGAGGLDISTQDRLVVLELDDQMRVRGGGCLEGFF